MDSKWVTASLIVSSLFCAFGFAYQPDWYWIAGIMAWLVVIVFADQIDTYLINPLWRKK